MPSRTAAVVLTLAVFAAIGVIMLGIISPVVADNTGTTSVTNETVVADYNESVDLRGYDIDPGSETVWGFNDTSDSYEQATSPDDYTLNEGPGEIEFNDSSSLIQDGEDVKVSYDYQASGPLATLVIGFVPVGIALLVFVPVAMRVSRMM